MAGNRGDIKDSIKEAVRRIGDLSREKTIKVISHYDTDGITSAAIISRVLQRWKKEFSLSIVKNLEEEFIKTLPENQILLFLDLGSGSLNYLKDKKTEIFILDHHEIAQEIPQNVTMINPVLHGDEKLSSAGICYLFGREISEQNKNLATLSVIGMVGDMLEKNISKLYGEILKDADTVVKKGLLLYPSTRPLDKALEYSSSFYIPNVTGSFRGVIELLRDAGIQKNRNEYKALYELTEEEMTNLITAVMLRRVGEANNFEMVGNLYLIKFFNKLEDAREISALINACSRMGFPWVSLGFCLGNKNAVEQAEKIYIKYKQHLVDALRYIDEAEKISGKNYTIINAQDKIKDTIIGTVISIISHSPLYSKGTVIVALAYDEDKIKVSARIVGEEGRNVREVLSKVVIPMGGEVGGHPNAAGCLIAKDKETKFISELKNVLDVELVKI